MKVLAIDPGYDRIGVAVLEQNNEGNQLLYSDCIVTQKSDNLAVRLEFVGDAFLKLLKNYKPDYVAIETLFFNKNLKTAIGVAQARGVIVYLAQAADCEVREFGPQEVKVAVTGYGKSDKEAVIVMVKRLVKQAPKKALDDEYDAIAIGITCLATLKKTY